MKWIFHVLAVCLLATACTKVTPQIPDGLYLVDPETATPEIQAGKSHALQVHPDFLETGATSSVSVLAGEYVPLLLSKHPDLVDRAGGTSRLLLSLDSGAAVQLRDFSARHIGKRVALVIGNQALTMHKVRDTITDGHLMITRCSDDACRKLERVLHVK